MARTASRLVALLFLLSCNPGDETLGVPLGTTLGETFGGSGTADKATGVAPGSVVVAATVANKIVVRKYEIVAGTWFRRWSTTVDPDSATVYRSGKPATDSSGNVYLAGQAGSDAVLVKLTSSGSVEWIQTVSGGAFEACAVEPAGTIVAVGTQGGDIVVVRFNVSGTQLGSVTYPSAGADEASDIAVDPSGRIFVTGAVGSPLDVVLLGYDSALAALWAAKTFDSGLLGTDRGTAIAVDGTAAVYVASEQSLGGSDSEWVVQRINPATGAEVRKSRSNPSAGADRPYDLEVDTAGDVYCAGTLAAGSVYPAHDSGTDMGVARWHSDGHLLWSNAFSSGKGEDGLGGILIAEGRLVVVGWVASGAGDTDGYVAEMALDGSSNPSGVTGTGSIAAIGGLTSGDYLQASGGVTQTISGSKAFLGNVGIGTSSPSYKLDVAGQIRSSSGGFVFPDGTTQATAAGSGVWATSGSDIYNSNVGNVGIGTSSPSYKLDVAGQIRSSSGGFLAVAGSAGAPSYSFTGDTTSGIYSGGAGVLRLVTGGSDRLSIDSAGNVGVGTTSATNLVSLNGDAARTLWMERHTTANTLGNSLTIQAGGATVGATDKLGGTLILQGGIATGTGSSAILLNVAVGGSSGATDRTPTTNLTIAASNVTSSVQIRGPNQFAATPTYSFSDQFTMGMYRSGDGLLSFSTNSAERVRIDKSGNVGIGTTSFGTSAAKVLALGNATVPTTSPADMVQLYAEDVSASSELKVRDEATNITVLSPHNFSLIGRPSEPMAWSFYSERGERRINVDMLRVVRLVEQMSGEGLVHLQEGQTLIEPNVDRDKALPAQVDRLTRENAELRARMARIEARLAVGRGR